MKKIDEKLRALWSATRPGALNEDELRLLAELRLDLLDILEQQEDSEYYRQQLIRSMEKSGYNDNGPAPFKRRGAPYDSLV